MARAIYGDMLAFFPELIRKIVLYEKQPTTIAGHFFKENVRVSSGVIQFCKAGDIVVNGQVLNDTDCPVLWTRSMLAMNTYVQDSDLIEYRRTKDNAYAVEGGFNVYILEKVTGNTDTNTRDTSVDLGVSQYK